MENTTLRETFTEPMELLIVHIEGDLVIEGTADDVLLVQGDTPRMEREGKHITLSSEGDCRIRVPMGTSIIITEVDGDLRVSELSAPLTIEDCHSDTIIRAINGPLTISNVGSDARITEINGPVAIDNVGSDLALRDINGPVAIDNVGSDLEAKRINGQLAVDNVGSDLNLKEINGNVAIDNVGSDAVLIEINGNMAIDNVGSDLVLDMPFQAPFKINVGTVGSDVLAKIRSNSRVRFNMPRDTEKTINVRGVRVERTDDGDTVIVGEPSDEMAEVTVGTVGSELHLISQGKSFRAEIDFDLPENLGEIISNQISQQFARLEQAFSRQRDRMREQSDRVRERAEEIRARERAERERERAERERERAERVRVRVRGARGSQTWVSSSEMPTPPQPPRPPAPPMPPSRPPSPVTDQERLAILKMVEARQITIEEAERLLAALEGRSDR
ncbi:MAG: hypothetical protein OHK0023_27010 [Anaerolineae bacterium]